MDLPWFGLVVDGVDGGAAAGEVAVAALELDLRGCFLVTQGKLEESVSGETESMAIAGICELVLETDDVDRLRDFYEEKLGLRQILAEEDEGRTWLGVGERCRLGIWSPGEREHSDRGGRHVHFALSVAAEDLDATCARLREQGVEVEGPVEHEGGDRSAYFFDPAGNRVELWDFFHDGDGAEDGVTALAEGDDGA